MNDFWSLNKLRARCRGIGESQSPLCSTTICGEIDPGRSIMLADRDKMSLFFSGNVRASSALWNLICLKMSSKISLKIFELSLLLEMISKSVFTKQCSWNSVRNALEFELHFLKWKLCTCKALVISLQSDIASLTVLELEVRTYNKLFTYMYIGPYLTM